MNLKFTKISIENFLLQFYLLKPDHVPKPEKEDISISGNTPDDEDVHEDFHDDNQSNNVGEQGNFRHQAREKKKKEA